MRRLGAAKDINVNSVLIVGAMFGSYFLIIKPILEALNLKKTKEEEERDRNEKSAIDRAEDPNRKYNPWNTRLYNDWKTGQIKDTKGKVVYIINAAKIDQLAKQIYSAIGRSTFSSDNEQQIEAVFKQLGSQLSVSQLADYYYQKYQLDMYQDIKNVLYTEETGTSFNWDPAKQRDAFLRILNYVDALPLFKFKK